MLNDNGLPVVGSESKMLGVRVPPHQQPDITRDANGIVIPGTGGMSVAPTWRDLPYFLIPKRLRSLMPDARGRNELACFRHGAGDFVESVVSESLVLKPDSRSHATIQPTRSMPLADFQQALAATRDGWAIDEA
jgi:hypothetical protein